MSARAVFHEQVSRGDAESAPIPDALLLHGIGAHAAVAVRCLVGGGVALSWANQLRFQVAFQVPQREQSGTDVHHVLCRALELRHARCGRARPQPSLPTAPASVNAPQSSGYQASAIRHSTPSWSSSTKFAAQAANEWAAASPAACFPKGRTLKDWQSEKRREARANKGGCHGQRLSLLLSDNLGPVMMPGVMDKRDDLPAHAGPRRGGRSVSLIFSSGDGLGIHQPRSNESGFPVAGQSRPGRARKRAKCPAVTRFSSRGRQSSAFLGLASLVCPAPLRAARAFFHGQPDQWRS